MLKETSNCALAMDVRPSLFLSIAQNRGNPPNPNKPQHLPDTKKLPISFIEIDKIELETKGPAIAGPDRLTHQTRPNRSPDLTTFFRRL